MSSANGIDRQTELTMATAEALDEAARAWMAYATARAMFEAQRPDSAVSPAMFEALQLRLGRVYGECVDAFQKADAKLRLELIRRGDHVQPAAVDRIGLALFAGRKLELETRFIALFAKHIAHAENLAVIDEHGVEWLIRFFECIGFDAGNDNQAEGANARLSDEQLHMLRIYWQMVDGGGKDADDRRLGAWLSRRFGISAVRFLDAETGWKAIQKLRRKAAG